MPRRDLADFRAKRYESFNLDLSRTAVHLIALLVADQHLKNACRKYRLYNLLEDSLEIEDSDVIRMTVELATGFRLIYWNAKYHEESYPVGDLWPRVEIDESEPLSVLEACNKIIHATELEFYKRKMRGVDIDYLKPQLAVSGKKGKHNWEAHIDMLFFCNEVLTRHSNFAPSSPGKNVPQSTSEA